MSRFKNIVLIAVLVLLSGIFFLSINVITGNNHSSNREQVTTNEQSSTTTQPLQERGEQEILNTESEKHASSRVSCADLKTETDLMECRREVYTRTEQTMKKLLETLHKNYTDEKELDLLLNTSQRTWEAFSEAECAVNTYYSRTGSAYEIYRLECKTVQIEARITNLKSLLSNP